MFSTSQNNETESQNSLCAEALDQLPAPYTGMSVSSFRQLPGMTPEKFALFIQNTRPMGDAFKNIFGAGLTLEELISLEPKRLKHLLKKSSVLTEVLKVMTKNHLLGIDKSLPEPKEYPLLTGTHTCVDGWEGSSRNPTDPYWGKMGGTKYTYTYQNIIKEEWDLIKNPQTQAVLDETIKGRPPEKLLHDWWIVSKKANGFTMRSYYSPEIPECLLYMRENTLPREHFKEHQRHYAYFQEKLFLREMRDMGLSIEEARRIPGFTQTKLELLFMTGDHLKFLVSSGIPLRDFAQVDEKRLGHVLNKENIHGLIYGGELVNIREIFGLPLSAPAPAPEPTVRALLTRYHTEPAAAPQEQDQNTARNSCVFS